MADFIVYALAGLALACAVVPAAWIRVSPKALLVGQGCFSFVAFAGALAVRPPLVGLVLACLFAAALIFMVVE